MLIQTEHRSQMPVHRRRRAQRVATVQHDHVLGWSPQPRHEPGDVIHIGVWCQPLPTRRQNSNHNFKLIPYARCVFGDRSSAAR